MKLWTIFGGNDHSQDPLAMSSPEVKSGDYSGPDCAICRDKMTRAVYSDFTPADLSSSSNSPTSKERHLTLRFYHDAPY